LVLAVTTVLGILSGCGSDDDQRQQDASAERVVVTRDAPNLPATCRPDSIGALTSEFGRALRRADEDALSTIWSGRFFAAGIDDREPGDARSPTET